jgi:filamentous hemagglutinin family protein
MVKSDRCKKMGCISRYAIRRFESIDSRLYYFGHPQIQGINKGLAMNATSAWLVLCGGIVPLMVMLPWSGSAKAQVTPDSTLNTTVSQTGNNFTITNGDRVGNNLFHSFSQFSVPSNGSAFFNNAADVQNIFSRVTGGNLSQIDGLIKANGSANLFLLNPSGIIFGANAQLNIGGSFIGTTANSIKFADGTEFSSTQPLVSSPLLTISVPIGLQIGSNPGAIQAQGAGHTGQFSDSLRVSGLNSTTGLQVQPGNTLALVGGNIALAGGLLSAPGGRIELGSVTSGAVTLNSNPQGFALSYGNASGFGNIQMTQKALASTQDFTNSSGGSIQLQGKQISLRDGVAGADSKSQQSSCWRHYG